MIIKKLTLDNIKSYVYEEIDFTKGINFILGANGSGKTTIIESIGLALFNYTKKTLYDLLRYNKTKGSIELEFTANDGLDYRIVRTIKPKSGTAKIIEIATDTEAANGVGEVYSFIKTVLRIPNTKDLAKMYEEIIAVPQGQYVTAFLEKPSIRKENFDKLFDLHIYKNTNIKLTSIASNIRDNHIHVLEKEIVAINGEVKSYDQKKLELETTINFIKDLEKNQKAIEKEIVKVKANRDRLENLKKELDKLQTDKLLLAEKIKNIEQIITKNSEELLLAQKAAGIVTENKIAYMKYQDNQQMISRLEKKFDEFLSIENKIKAKESEILVYDTKISNYQDNIKTKEIDYETRHQEIVKLNTESIFVKKDLETKEKVYNDKAIKNTNAYNEVTNTIKSYRDKIEKIKYYDFQYNSIVIKDWEPYENLDEKILEINNRIEKVTQSKVTLDDYNNKRLKIALELENAIANSQVSRDGNCPFFNEKCKNISEKSLKEYFEEIIVVKTKALNEMDEVISQHREVVDDERALFAELQIKEANKKVLEDYYIKIGNIKEEFTEEFKNDLPLNINYDFSDLTKALTEQLISKVELLETKEKDLNQEKEALVNENAQINNLRLKMGIKTNNINSLELLNKKLNDEIEELKHLLMTSLRNKKTTTSEINKIKEELSHVADAKTSLDLLKIENADLEVAKNNYLANESKAKEVEKINKTIANDRLLIETHQKEIANNNQKTKELEENYSPARLEEINKEFTGLLEQKSSITTSIIEKGEKRNNLQNEVHKMDEQFKVRDSMQIKLDRYNEINDFITKAKKIFIELPRELSIQYREYIGHAATKLYRQISREKVQLELTEDYDVIITEDDNQKNKKTIDVLSGGEQMSVAIAIRLSMLKHLSGLDIYFLDEPTVNLDTDRREKVADVVSEISEELRQMFVISHDDTFDQITDTVIKVIKNDNESIVG